MDRPTLVSGIRAAVGKVLQVREPDSIGLDDDLVQHGMDSLRSAELSDALVHRFGIDPMLELDRMTIGGIVDQVARRGEDAGSERSGSFARSTTVALAIDDLVPTSILLVLAYQGDVSPQVEQAIGYGLRAFPHFAGQIVGSESPFALEVQPDSRDVPIEHESTEAFQLSDLPKLSRSEWIEHFLPTASTEVRDEILRWPLLAVRTTRLADGGSVLGMLISHMLVDGIGLGLFLMHCCVGLRRWKLPQPNHSRRVLHASSDPDAKLPPWYVQSDPDESDREWNLAHRYPVALLSVMDDALQPLRDDAESSLWFLLTALLCQELSVAGGYTEAAMWCDVRGKLSIPRTYTGNVGCYWHESIKSPDESVAALASRLRQATDSNVSPQVVQTYQAIKQHELDGRRVRWLGTSLHVLPINLVPYSTSVLDFGSGGPVLARILTRNLHGLRISRIPDRAGFLVEACLPPELAATLVERCRARGIAVIKD